MLGLQRGHSLLPKPQRLLVGAGQGSPRGGSWVYVRGQGAGEGVVCEDSQAACVSLSGWESEEDVHTCVSPVSQVRLWV